MKRLKLTLAKYFKCTLTLISPKLNGIIVYFFKFGHLPNLKNPQKFNEKLLKLKLENYDHNAQVKKCADKYAVREYVESKGFGYLLNELIDVYDCVDDINWNSLPNKFVMKWNFGSGYNIICYDKSKLNEYEIKKKLKLWEREKYYLEYAEMQYKDVDKKIIIEKLLESENGDFPADYKVYCFHGKAKAILYISDRGTLNTKGVFFTTGWNYLGVADKKYKEPKYIPERPKSLDTMIAAAESLSKDFPFVRVDFYYCNGKVIFGEMTFTPAGCHDVSHTPVMTNMLHV